jgi:OPA family glycerol-3-phosphate transporter-like MFS transporter
MWVIGLAYFSTGVVRNGLEQWFPSYLQEVHNIPQGSVEFGAQAMLMPIAALAGAITAGVLSDKVFGSRRGPVVAIMYFAQAALLLLFMFAVTPAWCGTILIVLSFMFSGPHSLIGNAATLDFGGREAVGAATGFFDAMQYAGAALIGVGMGRLIDLFGWGVWGPSLIFFAVSGGVLMCLIWKVKGDSSPEPKKANAFGAEDPTVLPECVPS